MKCPSCGSESLRKNGRPNNRQRYRCKDCGRQFMEELPTSRIEQEISVSKSEPTTLHEAPGAGIAILLLDVENLKIDVNAEQFLASISGYSLQVKIAFANWRNSSLSKYDGELFERGYQLIHVPEGKNSADAQMMSMGAAIGKQYSDAKAVFVCSSDWLLTHLCNSLQNQGLTVYRVRREPDNILSIENRNTLEVKHYSLKMATEIPPLEEFVHKIQELLKKENESISRRSSELSIIASLLDKRCEISLDKQPKQSFSQIVYEEVEILETKNIPTEFVENQENIQSNTVYLPEINSQAEFEQEVTKIISNIPLKKNKVFVDLKLVDEKFTAIFGDDMWQVLKDLKINNDLEKFLKISPKFRVKKKPKSKEYQVAIAAQNIQTLNSQIISSTEELENVQTLNSQIISSPEKLENVQTLNSQIISSPEKLENVQTLNSQIISSPEELENALVNIIKVLAAHAPRGYICISNIGTEFQKQYSHSITTILKQLKLTGKFLKFLKSSNAFNLKKVGNKYKVAIANKK